jgi:hypothetical protein
MPCTAALQACSGAMLGLLLVVQCAVAELQVAGHVGTISACGHTHAHMCVLNTTMVTLRVLCFYCTSKCAVCAHLLVIVWCTGL